MTDPSHQEGPAAGVRLLSLAPETVEQMEIGPLRETLLAVRDEIEIIYGPNHRNHQSHLNSGA